MSSDDATEYFTVRIWIQDQNGFQQPNKNSHISLELHDGTYISVFRSSDGLHKCECHESDVARLGRDSDVTMRLLVEDHMRHPGRISTWLESYKQGEIIFDPLDTCCSVVYNLLLRSGCPSIQMEPYKLMPSDMKDYLYGMLRNSKKRRKFFK